MAGFLSGGASGAGGLLPSQMLAQAIARAMIVGEPALLPDQVQPASVDLRLGPVAYRVQASFLAGREATVEEKLARLAMHRFTLEGGAVLERGCVYIVPLMERLALPAGLSGLANPKSSTGRLDVFARLITDHGSVFDRIREGYHGPLYAEISPRTFSVRLARGARLVQLRLRAGPAPSGDVAQQAQDAGGRETLAISVDLRGDGPGGLIGWRAKKHTGLIDLDRLGHYDPTDFWEPLPARDGQGIVLVPDEFYILASRERVTVPPGKAAEMIAYDTQVGEFRVHYAGFFDPGFGHFEAGPQGTRAVLEVRSHEVPFLIEHGQLVGRLVYEDLLAPPDRLYGQAIGSSYQRQGLTLAKQFRR
jgi:dCTP deaminase